MNKEIARQWHDALLSGGYPQGHSALITIGHGAHEPERRYCCLGVLCDLAVKAGVITELPRVRDDGRVAFPDTVSGSETVQAGYLPRKVMEWAGLDRQDPVVRVGPGDALVVEEDRRFLTSLATLNDQGRNFRYIAQVIKENFLNEDTEN